MLSWRNTSVIPGAASSVQLEKQALEFGRKVWPGAGELASCHCLSAYLKLQRLVWCHPGSSEGVVPCVLVGSVPSICSLARRSCRWDGHWSFPFVERVPCLACSISNPAVLSSGHLYPHATDEEAEVQMGVVSQFRRQTYLTPSSMNCLSQRGVTSRVLSLVLPGCEPLQQ